MSAKTIRSVDGTFLRRRWHLVASLLLAVGLLAAALVPLVGGAGPARAAQGDDPAAVIAAYAAALNAGDLEGILAQYADDGVHINLPTPDGTAGVCLGKEQFGMYYEQAVADGARVEVVEGTLAVDGDRATYVARFASDSWRELGIESLEGNVEAVVVDGRIATHIEMLTPESVRELLSARGAIPAPPAGSAHQAHTS